MPGVNYYDGSQFREIAALEQADGQTAPAYRWDGSQWVKIFPTSTIPDSVVNNLDVWYPINEGSGTPTDAIAGNTLSLSGTSWNGSTSIYEGYSLDHDGVDDQTTQDETVDITGGVSICGWIYPRDLSTASDPIQLSDSFSNPDDTVRLQQYDGDSIRMLVNDSTGAAANDPVTGLSNNNFYFVGGTAEPDGSGGTAVETFVWDSTQQIGSSTTQSNDSVDYSTLTANRFAASSDDPSDRFFDGLTDAFGYNAGTVLSETDFADIWNGTKP